MNLEHHLEILVPVNNAIGVRVVLAEKLLDLFVCHIGATHILEERLEFTLLDFSVA